VLVLNVWGSWCAPCKKEQPGLQRAYADTAALGVRFVGIDVRDSRTAARAHLRRFAVTYPSLFDRSSELIARLRPPPPAVPTTYVVDRHGRLAATVFGIVSYDALVAVIRRVAAEQ